MKGEISNADIATQEFYNSITEDIKSHKLNNTEYKNLVKDINGIERKLYNFSDNYRKDQANIGSAEMGIRVEQIKKEANKYKEVKDYILRNHKDRIYEDNEFYTRIQSVDSIMKFVENSINDDGWYDDSEWAATEASRISGTYEPIHKFNVGEAQEQGTLKAMQKKTVEALHEGYKDFESNNKMFFPSKPQYGDEISHYENLLTQEGIDKMGAQDWHTYYNNQLDRLPIETDITEKDIWEDFKFQHDFGTNNLNKALENLKEEDDKYASMNHKRGALPSSFYAAKKLPYAKDEIPLSVRDYLVGAMNNAKKDTKNYPQLSSMINANENIKDMKSLHANALSQINYLKGEGRKNEAYYLLKEFNRMTDNINTYLKTDKAAELSGMNQISDIFSGVKKFNIEDIK